MKNTIITKSIATLLVVFALSFAATAQTPANPVLKERLILTLKTKLISNDLIVSTIEKNGVDFQLTNADEAELREIGADDKLIKAVRENYRGKKNAAVQTYTKTEVDYHRQALEALKKGDFSAAEKNAREVVRINPKSGDGYGTLAYALGLQELMKEAKEAARKAIELSPDDAELRKDMQELIDEGEEETVQNNTANQTSNTGANNTETVNREKSSGNVLTGTSGISPQAGLWKAKITNIEGRQDTMTFRVSANGGQIEDVVFDGYWRCDDALSSFKKGLLKKVDVNSPPGTFVITNGKFSDVKKEPYIAWTFDGIFNSATTAKGTFMIEYALECTTYKLEWIATRTGQ